MVDYEINKEILFACKLPWYVYVGFMMQIPEHKIVVITDDKKYIVTGYNNRFKYIPTHYSRIYVESF